MHVSLARVTKDKYHDGQRRMYSCVVVWANRTDARMSGYLGCIAPSGTVLQRTIEAAHRTS